MEESGTELVPARQKALEKDEEKSLTKTSGEFKSLGEKVRRALETSSMLSQLVVFPALEAKGALFFTTVFWTAEERRMLLFATHEGFILTAWQFLRTVLE
jgi:hypothetical protein